MFTKHKTKKGFRNNYTKKSRKIESIKRSFHGNNLFNLLDGEIWLVSGSNTGCSTLIGAACSSLASLVVGTQHKSTASSVPIDSFASLLLSVPGDTFDSKFGQSNVRSSSSFFGELPIADVPLGAIFRLELCGVTGWARSARSICALGLQTRLASCPSPVTILPLLLWKTCLRKFLLAHRASKFEQLFIATCRVTISTFECTAR